MTAHEVNFDGLVGPTHHYGGLSPGNLASLRFRHSVSHPRQAALQVLEKMKRVADLGLKQAVLPPHPRPHWDFLRAQGFRGSPAAVIEQAAHRRPDLLSIAYSSSFMWAANSATVSPSADTADGRVHLTPANLCSTPHRALEASHTTAILRQIFSDGQVFVVHNSLPNEPRLADEGAANHARLSAHHAAPGLELFVYGRRRPAGEGNGPQKYPARQSRAAAERIAVDHGLDPARVVFVQQSPAAIDAGAFHNDVVAVANENVMLCHARAFVDQAAVIERLRNEVAGFVVVEIAEAELSLEEAIACYLFNSQLLSLPHGGMLLLCPVECQESERARGVVDRIVTSTDRIHEVQFVDVRQSMRNGGGPACLRLRVVLTEEELAQLPASVLMTDRLYHQLQALIDTKYREQLTPADLADPALWIESQAIQADVAQILALGQ